MPSPVTCLHYRLTLKATAASTGFFAAVPHPPKFLEDGLAYQRRHPNDSFMQAYLIERIGKMDRAEAEAMLIQAPPNDLLLRALVMEAATLYPHLSDLRRRVKRRTAQTLGQHTPLVFLRSRMLPDQDCHRQWAERFQANIARHRPLPPPAQVGLAFPVKGVDGGDPPFSEAAHLKSVIRRCFPQNGRTAGSPRPPLAETIARAQAALTPLDLFDGPEMRHQSSLSLYALLRKWRFNHKINSGVLNYTLASTQTAYGRGLSLEAARASCLMEVVERCASFASVDTDGVVGTRRSHPLRHGSRAALQAEGLPVLDPNRLRLEVPYQGEPLYWIEGEQRTAEGRMQAIWVPAQCVFLFCNLDERALFSGLGSTGLASGNTMAEARLSALYELLERDNEAVNPFHPSRCFNVWSEDEQLRALLEDYRARGVHLQFQDISPVFGIPCCTCFVTHPDGRVAKGGGANLDGRRAVLSALTETPYPYPDGPPSAPGLADLPWLQYESLPNFSTDSPEMDLLIVEETLRANGFSPIYVDITRQDMGIPVVKA
ncbi:YcaO-like family protein [Desulfosarcina cetonica]|uniref:YcaO-like family protein n=1 Tax=Desulfosarcina cetonica TaxID=90730 RepID=UPI0006D1B639|nr:YcaO-like family protein [Desulfosarcina cetonica]